MRSKSITKKEFEEAANILIGEGIFIKTQAKLTPQAPESTIYVKKAYDQFTGERRINEQEYNLKFNHRLPTVVTANMRTFLVDKGLLDQTFVDM